MATVVEDAPAKSLSAAELDAAEAALRIDLTACYRLVALFGWDDLVATHISVRLPDNKTFLINPFGKLFNELVPSDLIKVDLDGNILSKTEWSVNLPGFVIHSAIHAVRHDAICAMHLHTQDGIAVSILKEGLLPLAQTSLVIYGDIAYHDFEGFASNLEERERLAADLGEKNLMFLRNHGTLALGESVAQAFTRMYYLENACGIQIKAMGTGRALNPIDPAVVERTTAGKPLGGPFADKLVWPAMLRKLEQVDPGWRG
jgi:ribulose-5-phosphate 4-epimerase/fuculose-1-phosphate aldolase